MENQVLTKSNAYLVLIEPLNALLEEFKPLPSFTPVTKIYFTYSTEVTEKQISTSKVTLNLIVYGGLIRWYVEYLVGFGINVNLEVQKFREFLIRLEAYLRVPFDKLPLYVPLPENIPQYKTINSLIMHRLRLGI